MGQPEPPKTVPQQRLVGLDLLRLVAVVLVLGRHMWQPPESWSFSWKLPFQTWHRGGWVGVDLFFVLSGFLVSGLLFNEFKTQGNYSIRRFYLRRFWKILPPFLTLITVTVVVHWIKRWPIPREQLIAELAFLQSYLPGLWNHTWSLAVEEHFYLLLPVLLTFLRKVNPGSPSPFRLILPLTAAVAIATLLARLLNWYQRPSYAHMTHLFASHLRLDSLLFGVSLSYICHFWGEQFIIRLSRLRWGLILGGAGLLAPAFVFSLETTPAVFTGGLTVFYLGSGMLLMGTLLCHPPRCRIVNSMSRLGAYSYSIYLWHMPVISWGVPFAERITGTSLAFVPRVSLYLLGSLTFGVIMAKMVEVPALRLRDYWFPPPAAPSNT